MAQMSVVLPNLRGIYNIQIPGADEYGDNTVVGEPNTGVAGNTANVASE